MFFLSWLQMIWMEFWIFRHGFTPSLLVSEVLMFIQGAAGIHPASQKTLSPALINMSNYYNCTWPKKEPLVSKVSPLEGPFSSRLLLFWFLILFLFVLKIVTLCWQHLFLKFLVWVAYLHRVEQDWSLLTTLNSCSFASKQ